MDAYGGIPFVEFPYDVIVKLRYMFSRAIILIDSRNKELNVEPDVTVWEADVKQTDVGKATRLERTRQLIGLQR